MGEQGHPLEDSGVHRSDPAEGERAPLDSGADGGPMDDASMGPGPADKDAPER